MEVLPRPPGRRKRCRLLPPLLNRMTGAARATLDAICGSFGQTFPGARHVAKGRKK
jgi:hypothetical protein